MKRKDSAWSWVVWAVLAGWLCSCGVAPGITGETDSTASGSTNAPGGGSQTPSSPAGGQTDPGQSTLCNNNRVDQDELCDSEVKPCKELDPTRFDSGDARCNSSCTDWDLSACKKAELPQSIELGAAPSNYLSLSDIEALLAKWAKAGPGLLEYKVFGTSNGKNNVYLRVSKAVSTGQSDLPKVLIDAGTHGDEWIGPAIVLGFMHHYISQYGKDAEITELINTRDVYFIPVVSPTGYSTKSRDEEGQDPNRSFPLHGATPTTSISNLMSLFRQVGFNATIDYHASGRMMLTPWGYTSSQFDEGGLGAKQRTLVAEMVASQTGSKYRWGSIVSMVGYVADNSSIDWFYT